jgi:hypothetical protein
MNGDLEMKHWSGKKGNDRYTMENSFGAINFNAKFQKALPVKHESLNFASL